MTTFEHKNGRTTRTPPSKVGTAAYPRSLHETTRSYPPAGSGSRTSTPSSSYRNADDSRAKTQRTSPERPAQAVHKVDARPRSATAQRAKAPSVMSYYRDRAATEERPASTRERFRRGQTIAAEYYEKHPVETVWEKLARFFGGGKKTAKRAATQPSRRNSSKRRSQAFPYSRPDEDQQRLVREHQAQKLSPSPTPRQPTIRRKPVAEPSAPQDGPYEYESHIKEVRKSRPTLRVDTDPLRSEKGEISGESGRSRRDTRWSDFMDARGEPKVGHRISRVPYLPTQPERDITEDWQPIGFDHRAPKPFGRPADSRRPSYESLTPVAEGSKDAWDANVSPLSPRASSEYSLPGTEADHSNLVPAYMASTFTFSGGPESNIIPMPPPKAESVLRPRVFTRVEDIPPPPPIPETKPVEGSAPSRTQTPDLGWVKYRDSLEKEADKRDSLKRQSAPSGKRDSHVSEWEL